jgi:thiol-disulfide isomerase/thioredoxin
MSIRPAALTAATVLVAMLGSAACAAETTDSGAGDASVSPTVTPARTRPPATTPTKPPSAPAVVGQLGFTGTTLDGKSFAAGTLAGKPVLLWFWAPWCPTCVAEAPDVLDVQQKYAGKVGIVGVAGLDERDNMQPFVDRTKTGGIIHLADPEGKIWKRLEVTQQSTYVLLDASGNVTFRGVIGGDELRSKIAALVG